MAAPSPVKEKSNPIAGLLKRLVTVKPREVKVTVGIDIGASSVKAIALGPRKGSNSRPIIGQSIVALNSEQETDASEAVKSAFSKLQVSARLVNLSVSGQWVIMRIIEMPIMKLAEMRQALPFEAQRYLPFSIQDVVIDGVVLGSIDAHKMWVLIVACKKDLIERRLDWIKRAGLEASFIDVDAVALCNAFLASMNGQQKEGTRSLVDVGAQLTNLVIFQGQTPYLVRDIPWGADKLIRNIAEQTGMEAATLSKELNEGKANPAIQSAMRLATETLVTELQLSFDYFENRFGQPPETIFVSGGLGQCAEFTEALKSHLTQTVSAWSPVRNLPARFTVAYGLALRVD